MRFYIFALLLRYSVSSEVQGSDLKSQSGCGGFMFKLNVWGQVAFELGLWKGCERLDRQKRKLHLLSREVWDGSFILSGQHST